MVKGIAEKHAEAVLKPHVEELTRNNQKQDRMISELESSGSKLYNDVDELRKKFQEELVQIAEIRQKLHASNTAMARASFGLYIGGLAEAEGAASSDMPAVKNHWAESVHWLEQAAQAAELLEPGIQQWILLSLAYSQKRIGLFSAALQNVEKKNFLWKRN